MTFKPMSESHNVSASHFLFRPAVSMMLRVLDLLK
jgi:hypothetical protein